MANILSVSFSATYHEEEANKTMRYLEGKLAHEPVSHQKGILRLAPETTDAQVGTNVNMCVLFLRDGKSFSYKIGDTANPEVSNAKFLVYDASITNVFLSNPDTDPIEVEYITASY